MTNYEKWRLYTRDIESPDIYIKWGFVSLIAGALQRRIWMMSNPLTLKPDLNSIYTTLFIVLVGDSSVGKGRVIKQVQSVYRHDKMVRYLPSGKAVALVNCSPDKVTCEKILELLSTITTSTEFKVPGNDKKLITAHSSCTFLIEELEVLFSKSCHDMVSVLCQLYDAGDFLYDTRHQGTFHIKNVCMNFLAGTTPTSIKDLLSISILKKGFTSRMITVFADAPRFRRIPRELDADQQLAYEELVAHVKHLASNVAGEVQLSEEAESYFRDVYESGEMFRLRANQDPRLADYYGRKKIHWLKLSMALHFAEQSDSYVIERSTMEEAYRMLSEVELRMHEAFRGSGRNELYDNSVQIMKYLQGNGETKYKKLWFNFSENLKREELNQCLEYLIGTDQIHNNNHQTQMLEHGTFCTNGTIGGPTVQSTVSATS